jgi:hypothetical protein
VGETDRIGAEKIIEFAVDFKRLELEAGDECRFHVAIRKGEIEIERWPRSGFIEFEVPGEEFEGTMWSV